MMMKPTRPARVPTARNLAAFTAKPGDPPRDTPRARQTLADLERKYGADAAADITSLLKSAAAIAREHTISRKDARVARWKIFGLTFDPTYEAWLRSGLGYQAIADACALNKGTVGEHMAALRAGEGGSAVASNPPLSASAKASKTESESLGSCDYNRGTGEGEFSDIPSTAPLDLAEDWTPIFERFGLSADLFEIVDDTVRSSTWQQSKRLDNGERDIINLYSYRARFRQKNIANAEELEAARLRAQQWQLPRRIPGSGLGEPVAAVLNIADMQLFKSEGGGVDATLDRLHAGLESFQAYLERQRQDRNVNEVVIVNNGDPFEGIAGNYASQTFTVQGTLRQQQNLVLDVWETFARALFPQFEKAQFVSVLCNHTEYGRQGGTKNSITSDSDSGGAFLAESLQRVLRGRAEFDHVKFTIPHDEMNVFTTAAGVPLGFNHGHKIPGNDRAGFERWLNGQVRGDRRAYEAKIWFTAHRHHYQSWDLGSAWGFMCPSCDGGSKWLRDTTGAHANSGLLSVLVGEHSPHLWSDVAFHGQKAA